MHRSPSELYIAVRRDKLVLMQTFLPYMGHARLFFPAFQVTQGGILASFHSVIMRFYLAFRAHSLLGALLTGHERRFHEDDRQ